VHVKADKLFEFAGLFAPVWVTGRMSTAAAQKSLYLIDGSADDIGYSLHESGGAVQRIRIMTSASAGGSLRMRAAGKPSGLTGEVLVRSWVVHDGAHPQATDPFFFHSTRSVAMPLNFSSGEYQMVILLVSPRC
jgi:hypothetical protein